MRASRPSETEAGASTSRPAEEMQSGERPIESKRAQAGSRIPLVVDLDGTLVSSDLMLESVFVLAKHQPLRALGLPLWLANGWAQFKHRLAMTARPDARTLPYNREFVDYLREQKKFGRPLVLATAADEAIARDVAQEVGLFDAVYASDGAENLSGERKRERLVSEFGIGGFDYAGDSDRDRTIWHAARKAILVGRARGAEADGVKVERAFRDGGGRIGAFAEALRIDHWLKNALVFPPLIAAHRLYEIVPLLHGIAAFVAFCLCASSVYLLNDLIDLPQDRLHPHKKHRPLASGRVSTRWAVTAMPLLLLGAFAAGLTQSPALLGVLGLYYLLMVGYCLRLREVIVLDVLTLAMGYALRVIAGAVASSLAVEHWLVLSCALFFLGLALLKRYAELAATRLAGGAEVHARAYPARDGRAVAIFGCLSGYLAVAVYAYHTRLDYALNDRHALVWLVFPLLLYWLTHIWLLAHRGKIFNDPVTFALADRRSQVVGLLAVAAILASA